jgi:hypothetical protein
MAKRKLITAKEWDFVGGMDTQPNNRADYNLYNGKGLKFHYVTLGLMRCF